MSVRERFSKWRVRELEKLAGMSLGGKLDYIFTYYKGWLIGVLLLAMLAGYAGDAVVQSRKITVLQGFFTNDEYGLFDGAALEREYAARLGLEKNERVVFDDDLYVDLTGAATQYTAASNGKIIAYMATGELDFIVTTAEVYEHYTQNVPMADLKDVLPEALYETLADCVIYGTDESGAAIAAAVSLERSRFLRGREHGETEYYLFAPYSVPHAAQLCDFIEYCFE